MVGTCKFTICTLASLLPDRHKFVPVLMVSIVLICQVVDSVFSVSFKVVCAVEAFEGNK